MLHRLNRLTLAALIGGAMVASYGTAYAQDEDMGDDSMAEESMGDEGAMDEGAMDEGAADEGAMDESADEGDMSADAGSSVWPHAVRDRPLTMAKGMWSAGGGIGLSNSFEDISLSLGGLYGGSYGLTDELTLALSYGVGISPSSDGKGPVGLHVAYTAYAEGALIVAPTATYAYDLVSETSAVSLGSMYWYNIGDKISVFGGGDQFNMILGDVSIGILDLPVAGGFQLDEKTFLSLGTNLASIVILDDTDVLATGIFGADFIPLSFTGTFSPSNTLDIWAGVSTDLKNEPGDSLEVGVGATFYGLP